MASWVGVAASTVVVGDVVRVRFCPPFLVSRVVRDVLGVAVTDGEAPWVWYCARGEVVLRRVV